MVTKAPAKRICARCNEKPPVARRAIDGSLLCKECFLYSVEEDVHKTISDDTMFTPGMNVAVGVSGGKDSAALLHCLYVLNKRHNYNINLQMLAIDEGIKGYRDDSLQCVLRTQEKYQLPLNIVSFKERFGKDLDRLHKDSGQDTMCSFCGTLRRRALDEGARDFESDLLVTGHNADDVAETIIMNMMRGDTQRLVRCTKSVTGQVEIVNGKRFVPKAKPFKHIPQKEIVLYAFHAKLDYFSTECPYSPDAMRGKPRLLLNRASRYDHAVVLNVIKAAEHFKLRTENTKTGKSINTSTKRTCDRCGEVSSLPLCQACKLVDVMRSNGDLSTIFSGRNKLDNIVN